MVSSPEASEKYRKLSAETIQSAAPKAKGWSTNTMSVGRDVSSKSLATEMFRVEKSHCLVRNVKMRDVVRNVYTVNAVLCSKYKVGYDICCWLCGLRMMMIKRNREIFRKAALYLVSANERLAD